MPIRSLGLKSLVLVLCCLFITACAWQTPTHDANAKTTKIERIYVFGDSNVDTGNLSKLFGSVDPRENVWRGRNSNGPVVVEYLAKELDAELINYAVSGATTGRSNIVSLLAPQFSSAAESGMLNQIQNFIASDPHLSKQDLVILWAGSNDIFRANRNNTEELAQRVVTAIDNLNSAIDQLKERGGTRFVIATRSPRPNLNSDDNLNGLDLNQAMVDYFQRGSSAREYDLLVFDAYSVIENMVLNPDSYGFKQSTNLCVDNPDCAAETYEEGLSLANTYINWDAAHKTTKVHALMALELGAALNQRFAQR